MAEFSLLVNGVDLARWVVLSGTSWRPSVRMRRAPVRIPGRHGTRTTGRRLFDEGTVALELIVAATTQAALETEANALHGLLGAASLTLVRRSGGLETSAVVELESIAAGDFVEAGYGRLTALLAVPGVFFRGTETTASIGTVTSSTPVAVPFLAGSTAPVPDALLRLYSFSGNAIAAGALSVTDEASGTGFTVQAAIPATTYLYVDCATHRAWQSASGTAWTPSSGTDVSGWVEEHPVGMLELTPAMQGTNPTDRKVFVRTSMSTSVSVRARAAYL